MSDAVRTFTEAEHFALVTDAVSRETADLTTQVAELAAAKSELEQRADVLEAEKAAAIAERDAIKAEFDQFKNDIEEAAAVAARRETRVARVKDANPTLGDDFFTSERADRWAAMSDEAFDALVTDLEAVKPATTAAATETAAFTGGETPAAPQTSALATYLRARAAKA